MGYEALGEVQTIQLGGINKTTGKKNPTELEGYYLGSEDRPNKFNSNKPQKFYMFETADGQVGIYGKTGLDRVLRGARIGAMTKVVSTGEVIDTGKGNPMKVFKAYQDKANFIEVASQPSSTTDDGEQQSDQEYASEEVEEDEPAPTKLVAKVPMTAISDSDRQAKMQALLNKHRVKSA